MFTFTCIKKNTISANYLLLLMFALILIDYILTFVGINQLNYITEANPLTSTLFDYSFIKGLSLRCLQGSIPVFLLYIVKDKINVMCYVNIIMNIIYLEICILFLHSYWILHYCISFFN